MISTNYRLIKLMSHSITLHKVTFKLLSVKYPAIQSNYSYSTAPFQTINLNIDLVVSMELIKQVAFQANLSKSS